MNAMKSILAVALISGVLASAVPARADEIIQGGVYIPEGGDAIIQGGVYIRESSRDQSQLPPPYLPKPQPEIFDPGLITLTLLWLDAL